MFLFLARVLAHTCRHLRLHRTYLHGLPLCRFVDFPVGHQHGHHRQVKRNKGCHNGINAVHQEDAHVLRQRNVHAKLVQPEEDWTEGDEERNGPANHNQQTHTFTGHLKRIHQRVADGVIAVKSDAAQMEDGGRAEHNVQAGVKMAEGWAKIPTSFHCSDHTVWHNHQAHQEVSNSQRHDERVCRTLQLFEVSNGENHQEVADNGADDPGDDEDIEGYS